MYGELIPLGGGDPIPLMKKMLSVGRRESNDIVLRFKASERGAAAVLNPRYVVKSTG